MPRGRVRRDGGNFRWAIDRCTVYGELVFVVVNNTEFLCLATIFPTRFHCHSTVFTMVLSLSIKQSAPNEIFRTVRALPTQC